MIPHEGNKAAKSTIFTMSERHDMGDSPAISKNDEEMTLPSTPGGCTSSPPCEDAPDPDEDDLDDLDDMLDDFSATKISSKEPSLVASAAPSKSAETESATAPSSATNDDESAEMAKQIEAGISGMMGELEKSPEMQAELEKMFKQLIGDAMKEEMTTEPVGGTSKAGEPPAKEKIDAGLEAGSDASFQDKIRRTMERMQASGDQATAAAASDTPDDFMLDMLKRLSSADPSADGGEEDYEKILLSMMEQMIIKEILYEPMKELNDKFPQWMERKKASISPEDLKRYSEQQIVAREIVAKFEEPGYTDDNASDREYQWSRMLRMQELGSPPPDLVENMDAAQEALKMTDEQCNPQ